MAQAAAKIIDRESARPAIDRAELARMTLGDRSLEREVLQLFERQAGLLLARMHSGEPEIVSSLAHTLKGSAASIGASGVQMAAAGVEQASAAERKEALDRLAVAIDEACAAISALLRQGEPEG